MSGRGSGRSAALDLTTRPARSLYDQVAHPTSLVVYER